MASFNGSNEDLHNVLAAHVQRHDWFTYNEPTSRGQNIEATTTSS